jgi:hypothetical protein
MKMRLMGAELFRADGHSDITKLIVAFWRFADAPKKIILAEWQQTLKKSCA